MVKVACSQLSELYNTHNFNIYLHDFTNGYVTSKKYVYIKKWVYLQYIESNLVQIQKSTDTESSIKELQDWHLNMVCLVLEQ